MALTKKEAARLKYLIKQHVKAEVNRSWAGSQPAEDQPHIVTEAKLAKLELTTFITSKVKEVTT